jgi:hypothetical protein
LLRHGACPAWNPGCAAPSDCLTRLVRAVRIRRIAREQRLVRVCRGSLRTRRGRLATAGYQ